MRRKQNSDRPRGVAPKIPSFTFNDPSLPPVLFDLTASNTTPFASDLGTHRANPISRRRRDLAFHTPASWVQRDFSATPDLGASRETSQLILRRTDEKSKHHSRWRYNALALAWNLVPSLPIPPKAPPTVSDCDPTVWNRSDNVEATPIPPLVHLALRSLFRSTTQLSSPQILTLPLHLITLVNRYAAVFRPDLCYHPPDFAISATDDDPVEDRRVLDSVAGCDGEFLFVGDGQSKCVARVRHYLITHANTNKDEEIAETWEEAFSTFSPTQFTSNLTLTSIQLLNLPTSSLARIIPILPITIKYLSLISFASTETETQISEVTLRKLAHRVPFLHVLDLSYNDWLIREHFEMVEWGNAWQALNVIGVRDCSRIWQFEEDTGASRPNGEHFSDRNTEASFPPFVGGAHSRFQLLTREQVALNREYSPSVDESLPPSLIDLSLLINSTRQKAWIDLAYRKWL